MKERSSDIDFISGLLILYMVFIHVCQWFGYNDRPFFLNSYKIFGFFMPWFFFKGGMFFQYRKIKDVIINSFKRLVKPYILWSTIGLLIYFIIFEILSGTNLAYFFRKEIFSLLFFGSVFGNLPLWFLITLFFVRIIFCITPQKITTFLIGGTVVLGVILNYINIPLIPYWIANTIMGLFYFSMGYVLKEYQYNRIMFGISVVIYLLIVYFDFTHVDMRTNQVITGCYWLWPIISLTGIICLNNIIKGINNKILNDNLICETISGIGKYSMNIYVIHWPILMIIYNLLEQFK